MKMRDRPQRMTGYPKEKMGSLSKLSGRDPRIRTLLIEDLMMYDITSSKGGGGEDR